LSHGAFRKAGGSAATDVAELRDVSLGFDYETLGTLFFRQGSLVLSTALAHRHDAKLAVVTALLKNDR
jgi:hypothetical protein